MDLGKSLANFDPAETPTKLSPKQLEAIECIAEETTQRFFLELPKLLPALFDCCPQEAIRDFPAAIQAALALEANTCKKLTDILPPLKDID